MNTSYYQLQRWNCSFQEFTLFDFHEKKEKKKKKKASTHQI